jgi:formate hydrogenlyase subunit 6/NADH:ubiquinone oxidoreductase subunit I
LASWLVCWWKGTQKNQQANKPQGKNMKLGAMLKDISTALVKRPITEKYPFTRRAVPERLRGRLVWNPAACTGCGLCATDCPANALEVLVLDKKAKRFVVTYHVDRCTFCAQCVHSCRQGCLQMEADEWELAALARKSFVLTFSNNAGDSEMHDTSAGQNSG